MTTYYVDPTNGNDSDDGLSWANAFLTLNGAEDEPVAAGDTVYVGPGVYRESLTLDIDGSSGNPITYIGDTTGENTDGVGGVVRITGSDNDQSTTRNRCLDDNFGTRDYRTFRGFLIDMAASEGVLCSGNNWIIEDCIFMHNTSYDVRFHGASQSTNTVRRCVFLNGGTSWNAAVNFAHSSTVDNTAQVVENCLIINGYNRYGVRSTRIGGITVRNCTFYGGSRGTYIDTALTVGQTFAVNNCIIQNCNIGLNATTVAEMPEDYNTIYGCLTARQNVNVGGNSVAYPALFNSPVLYSGVTLPWWFGELSEWSQVAAITGTGTASDDMFGQPRPATAAKLSWGPIQFADIERETGTVRTGSVSIVLHDAARHQIFVPVTNDSTTISVYVHREANYAGTNPQLIVKQPGQSDDTTTDAAAASQWNELTTTLTPAASPPHIIIELVSNNTATSGNYDVFFDDLTVT
jgi:hypothetical protein